MKSRFVHEGKWPLAVDGECVKNVVSQISEIGGPISISAQCSDKTTREFENVDELLGYRNPVNRKITGIDFASDRSNFKEKITVSLSDFSWRTIKIEINGDDEVVTRKGDSILVELRGAKPWFAFLYLIDPFLVLFGSFILLVVGMGLLLMFGIVNLPPSSSSVTKPGETLVAYAWMFITLLSIGLIYISRWFFFPKVTFRIGLQEVRYQVFEKIRWGIAAAFFIGPLGRLFWGMFR